MADLTQDIEEEKPLDPAAERLRAKMMRLMAIGIGSMMIGIFAVLFAIVYKMNNSAVKAPAVPAIINSVIDVPDGFTISETQLSEGIVVLRGVNDDGQSILLLFDAASGEARGKIFVK